jgi:hypothetical protein
MNVRAFSFLIYLLICSPSLVCATGLVEQELVVHLLPESSSMTADATLKLADPEDKWPGFLLAPHAIIESLHIDGEETSPIFEDGHLTLSGVSPEATVEVNYTITYDDPVPDDFVGIEDPSYGVTATIKPQGVYLASASLWHLYPEKTQQSLAISIVGDKLMTGVTSGYLQSYCRTPEQTVTSWQIGRQEAPLTMAAGHYFLEKESLGDIQVMVFLTEANRHLAEGYLESVREYLDFYQDLLGPYPYEKFAVVENFYPTGYGLPGWTLLGSSVVRLPFIRTTSLPHEIVHAWWGNAIDVDIRYGNWAEGLATYLADYYLKEVNKPDEALEYRRKLLRDYAALAAGNDYPLADFIRRTSKVDQAIGYGKAAMVFHMLRQLIGDEAFWAGLKAAAIDGRGEAYHWDDLRSHFEKASGENLHSFFTQWIKRSGAPTLEMTDVNIMQSENGWQVSGLLKQDNPVHQLAVPLRLVADGQVYEQVVGLTQKEDCFLFSVSRRPVSLSLDPEKTLFRALYDTEVPAAINKLRAAEQPIVVIAKGSEPLLSASRDLLRGLRWHNAAVVTEKEYLEAPAQGRDILFIGVPEDKFLQEELKVSLEKLENGTRDNVKSDPNRVVFLVRKSTVNDHVVAYFLPGSVQSAQDTARRIPHYGQYSYLIFENGANQVKATWETQDSRLTTFFNTEDSR